MSPSDVGRRLGVGPQRVRQLDAELAPMRTVTGRRVYTRPAVEVLAARRDAAGAGR